ncbi:hypothetical protein LJC61_09245 [Ruminococcaceae bacterium OttesenSCG-928-A16]|nr:hypothetical protein [Ruminococcaceae bacterium OttesenSCG-928-A16]
MTGREAFTIWAPVGARWVDWVRPVPFIAMDGPHSPNLILNLSVPPVMYIAGLQKDTAVFVDMPGYEAVNEGVALAKLGYRPIPLYNGTNQQPGAMPLVENHPTEAALQWGALQLQTMQIAADAPPAFLLDSNRLHRYKMDVSVFDNSWDIYFQDMPSAEYFLSHGIDKVLVRGEKIQEDLGRILHGFQKKGIEVWLTNGYNPPQKVVVKKPRRGQG